MKIIVPDLDFTLSCCPESDLEESSTSKRCQIHRTADAGFEIYDDVYRFSLIGLTFTQSSRVEALGESLIHVGQVDSSVGRGPIIAMISNKFDKLSGIDGAGGTRFLFILPPS